MQGLLAGVANVDLFEKGTGNLIVSTKTLVDSGINMAITGEEARGGQGNILLGKYYHDSSFGLTLTDQIWDLQYLALNCGGGITAGSDIMTTEQVTVSTANTITVSQTPVAFTTTVGVIGWYKLSTQADTEYKKFTFDSGAKTATITGLTVGENVCVKYVINSSSARKFTVNADYIPSTVHAVMTIGLYRAGTTAETITNSSRIGSIVIDVPNFQLEGAQDLALTSSGIASVALSGSALATFSGNVGCSDHGYYATITEEITGASEFDNVIALAVADGDIDLVVGEKETLKVYKIYSDGTQPSLIDNSKLTITSEIQGTATVANGVVTAVHSGKSVLTIVATDKTTLSTSAVVTVAASK